MVAAGLYLWAVNTFLFPVALCACICLTVLATGFMKPWLDSGVVFACSCSSFCFEWANALFKQQGGSVGVWGGSHVVTERRPASQFPYCLSDARTAGSTYWDLQAVSSCCFLASLLHPHYSSVNSSAFLLRMTVTCQVWDEGTMGPSTHASQRQLSERSIKTLPWISRGATNHENRTGSLWDHPSVTSYCNLVRVAGMWKSCVIPSQL